MSFNKKFIKLIKTPRIFFSDFLFKRFHYIPFIKRYNGFHSYTIISACYNVAPYLDTFFKSITNQSLDFRKNIYCIMIDDGSTDNTREIIEKWVRKYPKNIFYKHQENQGQAVARNLGLSMAKTKWVTFIDPDDFINKNYLLNIDNLFRYDKSNIQMVGTHLIFFHEDKNLYIDKHPLTFKFKDKLKKINIKDLGKNIHLSAASAFFNRSILVKNKIVFDERIKPSFEDASFVNTYLLYCQNGLAVFLKDTKYFYRKRSNLSSTLDNSFYTPENFYDKTFYGRLPLLRKYYSSAGCPNYIDNVILYSILWDIKKIINNSSSFEKILSEKEKNRYLHLLDQCFSYISASSVLKFNLAGCSFYHKVGMLNCFKNIQVKKQIVYIKNYDYSKHEILLNYYTGIDSTPRFFSNNKEIFPRLTKISRDDFFDRTFVLTKWIWLPLPTDLDQKLSVSINDHSAEIKFKNILKSKNLTIRDIISCFKEKNNFCKLFKGNWIFMDRVFQADDNAEHLYRYILHKQLKQNIYFVLDKKSPDWPRLKKEGFKLLAYGSLFHKIALKNCSKIISSQMDENVVNFFGNHSLDSKKIINLRHGAAMTDQSRWLNKKKIDLFITTTRQEYEFISKDYSPYQLTKKEVKLTGFPRYDSLFEGNQFSRLILVMPTWRKYLQDSFKLNHNDKLLSAHDYFITWKSFLNCERLKSILTQYECSLIFCPHPNLQNFLHLFSIPSYITGIRSAECSIQYLLKSAGMFITDYSSVAFDFAYLRKPLVYYQFDDTVFFGSHTCRHAFDYAEYGFGNVVKDENELCKQIEITIKNNFKMEKKYIDRIHNAFPFFDNNNCKRVYEEICKMDNNVL